MITWRKSSYSGGGGSGGQECVEVAAISRRVGIRDSMDTDGPALALSPASFRALIRDVKAGSHDLL
ncbi:DUF397 domain-containing protein [Actinomadura macra]|uniref:DUF397 domain-containing protein n=1 Tax=Actinomadura macra TaxID=46164 RepID=UPI00083241E6|nr:DUF397 domain-containing protein [Actinomadura macra]